jgi:anti-anti-sigma factor
MPSTSSSTERFVLSPNESLVAGGPAEDYERQVQALYRDGHRHLVTDLRRVPSIDSAGVRALVRGYTSAQRLEGTFKLANVSSRLRTQLELAHLLSIFEIFDSVDEARARHFSWQPAWLAVGGAALVAALVYTGSLWGGGIPSEQAASEVLKVGKHEVVALGFNPLIETWKLVAAFAIGLLVTGVQRHLYREKPMPQSLEHAQVLLCVAGAMMMVIIGNSMARAFGILGIAGIIRFRTPVEDPRDTSIIFLQMGLGMAAGLGAFTVAGLGTLFLCLVLVALDRTTARKPRTLMVEISAEGRDFPTAHVESVFAQHRVTFEPREVSQGKEVVVRYHTTVGPTTALEAISEALVAGGKSGVKSVSWEAPKKSD